MFSGMLGVTLFGLFLTPVFYVIVQRLAMRMKRTTEPRAHRGDSGGEHA